MGVTSPNPSAPPPLRVLSAEDKAPPRHLKRGLRLALGNFAAHLILLTFSLFAIFPIWWVVAMALDPNSVAAPSKLVLIPEGISFAAFARVLENPTEVEGLTFSRLLWNSIMLSAGTTAIGIGLGATAAYAFSRFRFPGRESGLMSFLVLQMFPAVATIAPLYVLLSTLQIRTSLFGLAIAYAAGTLPFAIWNMKGYFDTVPKDLEEAALIDGCTPTGAFWRIILPLAAPAVAVTALFAFMTGWTEIVLAWTMLENPKTFTLAMALYGMVGQYSTTKPWSEFAAMSILISLPVVVVMLFLQRYIVSGLTSGAVKG
ncbi:MAG: sugar ABC transporter permease [Candidatus Sericytochromatia bacterium]|nr:sugar ABC transporter permease [Candidatus Sericytochromatia bacterium]